MNDTYLENWPCKMCGREFKFHVQIGTPHEEGAKREFPANLNWCFSKDSLEYKMHPNTKFTPMDNLTLIENMAKRRGIIKETPQGK